MLLKLDKQKIEQLTNPQFQQYARIYQGIHEQFYEHVQQTGLPLAKYVDPAQRLAEKQALAQQGCRLRNGEKSLYLNQISPACLACQKGVGSFTTFISLACHRHCYFCFNPNQEDYAYHRQHKQDAIGQLEQLLAEGMQIAHLALTGGEPLLHRQETIQFFQYAHTHTPDTYTRLYTSGDQLDENLLAQLRDAHLQEIRFSIKMEDPVSKRQESLQRIARAKEYIPVVMVEMPVIPRFLEEMKELLLQLDRLGIFGINLLEFCFPFHNAAYFQQEGYQIKNPPCDVLYNYWYAGGLPVAGSEEAALQLLQFSIEHGLKLGVHYCSFDNKHTGQVYIQNHLAPHDERYDLSERDYFLKAAKVFGADIPTVLQRLDELNEKKYTLNQEWGYLEFPVAIIPDLLDLNVEIGVSSYIHELREDELYLRELEIALVDPASFDLQQDI